MFSVAWKAWAYFFAMLPARRACSHARQVYDGVLQVEVVRDEVKEWSLRECVNSASASIDSNAQRRPVRGTRSASVGERVRQK